MHVLSFLIFIPLMAALGTLLIPSVHTRLFRAVNLAVTLVQLVLLTYMLPSFRPSAGLQWVEQAEWFTISLGTWGNLQAQYLLAVDGLSLPLVILSILVLVIVAISSWKVERKPKGYFALLLLLNGSIIGTFCAQDFLLFYLFFEFMLLPLYFLIGIWGGPRREYASIKFLLYTLLGSLFILVGILALYVSYQDPAFTGLTHTLDMSVLANADNLIPGSVLSSHGWIIGSTSARTVVFFLVLIGFAIKLPVVPLHTWLPDAHVEASTPISVILAALLLKVGGYGMLRVVYPMFPDVALAFSGLVAFMGVLSIIYGALNALAAKDLKRMIAYSSVSHMGFVWLGVASLTPEGVSGAVYQLFSHGILSALLFLLAGVLYDRTGDRTITHYSGLSSAMPAYFAFVLLAFFASLGLPGFSGFIAELLVLMGAFASASANGVLAQGYALAGLLGILLSAGYFLWTIQRMFFGPYQYKPGTITLTDITQHEWSMLLPLALLTLYFGIFPQTLLDVINPFSEVLTRSILDYLNP
jgi:NADH-quinone oxidoreductase subunit M